MKEKVRRLLDLVRAGRLSLEDAAPLLAALHPRLALTDSDRELLASLLARDDLDSGQVAEHLLLLRGVRDTAQPPFPPRPPRAPGWNGVEGLVDRLTGGIDDVVGRITEGVDRAFDGAAPRSTLRTTSARILRVEVESSSGDEYAANLPVSLAPHLAKLIPPHGIEALEAAGLSIEALQLLIAASPPPGPLIEAEDSSGNSVRISLK